ncbi:flavodoxin domain-containing protein [Rhodococcus sp. 14-2483-1-2]|uniref:flavodoxin domain-containing protein n=1 Tax=Rhodococcus sp. 14-2483-1-2 TaxID=2023147 RepID=UPI000B9AC7C4|nr:flavodoxin domain-containing protein [Rhodococcus sp. 14-2483-1-2]OZF26160.1 hypothetical protein CH295_26440 [Rhodococcus sp. 14-2483-1-2]
MSVVVLYGTETGNAEECAIEISRVMGEVAPVDVHDMSDYSPQQLLASGAGTVVVVTATHGEGELAGGGVRFFDALLAMSARLEGVRFMVFGLGDSYYTTYNRASEIVVEQMSALGATQLGATFRYDASSGDDPEELAGEWAREMRAVIAASVAS